MDVEPIGVLRTASGDKATAPRQGVLAAEVVGTIELHPGRDWSQALDGLEHFERVWILFHFHEASDRGNRVRPPGSTTSLGVLATRSPHRPNPIGLTCARLESIDGRHVRVRGHDLIDGTPVLDLKPYLPFADAFPDARTGWHAGGQSPWRILYRAPAWQQLQWLADHGADLRPRLDAQLRVTPVERRNRRLSENGDGWTLSIGTWRVDFELRETDREVCVQRIASGYAREQRWPEGDPYGDRELHQRFTEEFPFPSS